MIENSGDTFSLRVETVVDAPIEALWDSLMDPKKSAEYFWGITFVSDLKAGSPITWSGEWEGKSFVDRGVILEIQRPRVFRYDYFSAVAGLPDLPENHRLVTYSFDPAPGGVRLSISQDKAKTREEAEHSEKNWMSIIAAIKDKLEKG
jgi:uncharacterized protein YndB with AHSA1/START domain